MYNEAVENMIERIREGWESPEGFFGQPQPWQIEQPAGLLNPQPAYTWATDTPIFAVLDGWPMYVQMVAFSLFLMTIVFYPFGNVVITAILKKTVKDTIAAVGPVIMAAGWILYHFQTKTCTKSSFYDIMI